MSTKSSSSSSADPTNNEPKSLLFGKFRIAPSQIFYESPTKLTSAIVNLRPIVPGHVLIISNRVVPTLSQLSNEEYDDLWRSVRCVQSMLAKHYDIDDNGGGGGGGGFNVAVQDGRAAGQSVPHVHVHILPRKTGDFVRNDDVYDELEDWAPTQTMRLEKEEEKRKRDGTLVVPDDDDRRDRTMEEMEAETNLYRSLLV